LSEALETRPKTSSKALTAAIAAAVEAALGSTRSSPLPSPDRVAQGLVAAFEVAIRRAVAELQLQAPQVPPQGAFSLKGFAAAYQLSLSGLYALFKSGLGPETLKLGGPGSRARRVIPYSCARAWEQRMLARGRHQQQRQQTPEEPDATG
jgi:hypothetical protein